LLIEFNTKEKVCYIDFWCFLLNFIKFIGLRYLKTIREEGIYIFHQIQKEFWIKNIPFI